MLRDKSQMAQIYVHIVLLSFLPMLYMTDWSEEWQAAASLMICVNSFVRSQYPTTYRPAGASYEGFLYSPQMARSIATVAELLQYHMWAVWVDQPFWGSLLGNVCITGEVVSWLCLIL